MDIKSNGYKIPDNQKIISLNEDNAAANGSKFNAMINLNRILFFFKNDIVWIYSIINDTLIKNESPGLFTNLFPTKNQLKAVTSAHYSYKLKKFFFFSNNFYIEYENQSKFTRKNSLKNMSTKLTHVIQNYEDDTSVYLVDANSFIYYLNLKNDYLESVDRKSASFKLFYDCIHE